MDGARTLSQRLEDLPLVDDVVPVDWKADLVASSRHLFATAPSSILRTKDNGILIYCNNDVRTLAANPDVGNAPTEVLSVRAFRRVLAAGGLARDHERGYDWILRNQVFTTNPPLHGPTRRLLSRQLVPPRNVQRFAPLADRLVADLVQEGAEQGEIEFGRDFAEELTARFWASVLGLSPHESQAAKTLMAEMRPIFLMIRSPEEARAVDEAAGQYMDVVGGAIDRNVRCENNELLLEMDAELRQVDIDDKPPSIGQMLAANLVDGYHTAALAVANATYCLLTNDEANRRVRDDPGSIRDAYLEGTRLQAPVAITHRYALRDLDYEGLRIPCGTLIGMVWAAANRDPHVFEEPDTYRLNRQQAGTTTFGWGAHICPGRNITRLLAESALAGTNGPKVHMSLTQDSYNWVPYNTMRQLSEFGVRITLTR